MRVDPLTREHNEALAARLNDNWKKQNINLIARAERIKPRIGESYWSVRSDAIVRF